MKKNHLFKAFYKKYALNLKLPLVMKITMAFLFAVTLQLSAATGYAQRTRTSILMPSASVEQVLNKIEETSEFVFLYNDKTIQTDRMVSVDSESELITDILDDVFNGTNVTYTVVDKQIILSTQEKNTKDNNIEVNGVVKDVAGNTLIGVNITNTKTYAGTTTNVNGEFSIRTKKGETLEASYIGYITQTMTITNDKVLNITLQEDTQVLNEVVVTALGIKRDKKALSYNVQQINQDQLVKAKDANFVNSLNGKIAGVTINKSSTGIGGASRVIMRGAKSIEGDNNALYVVDGIPLFNTNMGNTDSGVLGEGRAGSEGIADFNPEDIESISVLSGPSAAALYGSSAANGVILITTKKGVEGKLQISVSSLTEFSDPLMMPEFQNTYGNRDGVFESWGGKLATPSTYNPANDFLTTGTNLINSVTLSTGNKYNQTFASVSSTNSTGIVPNNSYDRLNLTVRNSSSLLKDKLQLTLGGSYVKQEDMNMVSQGQYWNPIVSAYLFPRGENFNDIKTFERYDVTRNFPLQYWPVSEGTFGNQNPYWTAYRNLASTEKDRYMFNAGLAYDITDWLNVSGRYRMDHTNIELQRKIYASSNQKFAKEKGNYEYSTYKDRQEYADFMININKTFNDFSIVANIGGSYSNYSSIERGYGGNLSLVPNLFSIQNINPADSKVSESGGNTAVRNFAAFASAEIGWKSMLYLTVTGRNDWNSRLVNSSEESFFYPSVGLSAIVSEMVKLPEFISYLKVRGSYTQVGAPISQSGLTPGTITTPIIGGILKPTGIYPFSDFKAERTNSYEMGVSLRLVKRISIDATWYKSNTYNQTFLGDLPKSSGYKQVYLQAGDVENRGWEVLVRYNDKFGDIGISSSVAYSRNRNEIIKMVEDYKHPLNPELINIPEVVKDGGRVILKEGGSINDIYASSFLKKDNQGFVEIKENGEFAMETVDPVLLGKTTPDYTIGWNNSFSYKGFELGFLINGRFGGVVTSSTEAILDRFGVSQASAEARDQGGVMIPNQGRVDANKYYGLVATGESETAGYYTYSATNVRLQELSFGYTFPSHWFKNIVRDLTVSFVANNPWMIYCKAPYDPELTPSTGTYGQGNDYFMQPSLKSLGFSIKAKF